MAGSTIPFTSIYPSGSAASAGASVSAGDAQVNAQYPGMPAGAQPIQVDLALTAATSAAGATIYQPPPDKKLVVASAFITADAAGRVAICDNLDIAGNRIVVLRPGANGGASPNLVPVPYPQSVPGTPVVVVSNIAGNVDVRVSGWLQ